MNGRVLSERRRELGISVPRLAASAGVTRRLVDQLEESSWSEEISVKTLRALAAALGLAPAELLVEQDSETVAFSDRAEADAAVITNILARVATPVTPDQLAAALDWDGKRLDDALAASERALACGGQRLQTTASGLTTVPAPDKRAEEAAAEIKRQMIEDDHLGLQLLWKVWTSGREALPQEKLSAEERKLAQELLACHVLDLHDSGYLRLSRMIKRSLAPAVRENIPFYPGEY